MQEMRGSAVNEAMKEVDYGGAQEMTKRIRPYLNKLH